MRVNYDTDNKEIHGYIMDGVIKHFEAAKELLNMDINRIFGIFLVGSQNYNLHTEISDIDTVVVVFPSMDELLDNTMMSTEHHLPNGEHITLVDFRAWVKQLKKQNLHTLEALFTQYCYINPMYGEVWKQLQDMREDIAHYNELRAVNSAVGVAASYHSLITKPSEKNMTAIEEFGYDPKSFCNLLRILHYLRGYLSGMEFDKCLVPLPAEWMRGVKSGKERIPAEWAIKVADNTLFEIRAMRSIFEQKHEGMPKRTEQMDSVDKKLKDCCEQVLREYLKAVVFETKNK